MDLRTPLHGECLHCWLAFTTHAFGCDASLAWTKVWAAERGRSWVQVQSWVERRGAFCDCEVLGAVFADRLGDGPDGVADDEVPAGCPDCSPGTIRHAA
jgi:hypothetical protein